MSRPRANPFDRASSHQACRHDGPAGDGISAGACSAERWTDELAPFRAAAARWQLRAEAALITLALAWFALPALAAWIEGARP
jgi:hypothetical protein